MEENRYIPGQDPDIDAQKAKEAEEAIAEFEAMQAEDAAREQAAAEKAAEKAAKARLEDEKSQADYDAAKASARGKNSEATKGDTSRKAAKHILPSADNEPEEKTAKQKAADEKAAKLKAADKEKAAQIKARRDAAQEKIKESRKNRKPIVQFAIDSVKNIWFLIRSAAFVALLLVILITINNFLTPKFYYESGWPTTLTYSQFYELEEDSVDLLFLGSSHAACAFSPQVLYDTYGIQSYNLSSGQQSVVTSYYWLKEALQYQSPKVVVFDMAMLYDMDSYNEMNATEGVTRQVFDVMRWGEVKWEAINDVCSIDETQDVMSYVFPNIRYHTRWQDLTADDFSLEDYTSEYDLMGFIPKGDNIANSGATHYLIDPSVDGSVYGQEKMMPLMKTYLDKMVALCKEEGIQLVLVKTPYDGYTDRLHNANQAYADANKLPFYDFNVLGYYNATGMIFSDDMQDQSHVNLWGGEKVTKALGYFLTENKVATFENKKGAQQWKDSSEFYAKVKANYELKYIEGYADYLKKIDQKRYTIFVVNQGTSMLYQRNSGFIKAMKKLGFNLDTLNRGEAYVAIRENGKVTEYKDYQTVSEVGVLNGGKVSYSLTGNVLKVNKALTTQNSSVIVNNEEYSPQYDGINIVIYDTTTHMVINEACYGSFFGKYILQ